MKHSRLLALLSLVLSFAACGGGGSGSSSGGGSTIGGGGSGTPTMLTITLKGDYFAIPTNDPDFHPAGTGPVAGLVQSTLGPTGLPMVSTKGRDPLYSISDLNSNSEILWWSTAEPGSVQDFSAKFDALPFTFQNFFPVNQTNDALFMRTVHWKGTITAPSAATLIFTEAADDSVWVFIDGKLVVDDGGIKSTQTAQDVSTPITTGDHSIDIFYADRSQAQAALGLVVRSQ
jgi:fibro-slime domain-containing protein